MRRSNDLLSPDTSPHKLQMAGVKRVNNMPLIIAAGIMTVFILLIGLVAQKRANAQNQIIEPMKLNTPKKNTMSLAYEVVGNHRSGMIGAPDENKANINEPASPLPPIQYWPQKPDIVDQSIPDTEMERIRQEKMQAFEEAVNAKTSIVVDNTRLTNRENTKTSSRSLDVDISNSFKVQLQQLQGRQSSKSMPQTLGGEENDMRWNLNSTLQQPNSRYELRAGGVIPGVMISGISSELPGQIIGQVSQNVYDTATGKYLLIPQGTKLVGIYSSDVSFGHDSVLVAWQRLVFPDGKALDIGSMLGADSAGFAGFRDKADHHYTRIYGTALLMSGIVAGITYSQNLNQPNQIGYNPPTAGSVLSQALGQQLGEVTSQLVSKNLNVSSTIHVRPGYRFNVIVIKDLSFKRPYQQFLY